MAQAASNIIEKKEEGKPDMVSLTIDGNLVEIERGKSILDAARKVNVKIPTLCHHEDLCVAGNCRVCVVEVEGARTLQASCAMPADTGMVIRTNTPKVRQARKDLVALLVSEHKTQCTTCFRSTNCELQDLAAEYNIDNEMYINLLDNRELEIDNSSFSIEKDDSKCIRCQRCVRTCNELQLVNAVSVVERGQDMKISTFLDMPMNEVVCVNCGQCVIHCPTGALTERRYFDHIWEAMGDPTKHVMINIAPSVRVGLGEMFGLPPGSRVTGKMVAALKKMGFDAVLDTNFAADLTIMEEGTELLERLRKKIVENEDIPIPMITSCCPGWVKYAEHMYPDYLGNLSTCKSPQQMFGALAKTYYAEQKEINPWDVVCVAGMPCAAKKYEANRPEMRDSGFVDIDAGLTTREIGAMIKQAGITFDNLEEGKFDDIITQSSGAGAIFGATGGVMEAAIRTVYELVTGREVPFENLRVTPVRGMEKIKEASLKLENVKEEYSYLEGITVNVAIAHGLTNARHVMEQVKSGNSPYHFIEIMACPGGCIGGGGQPIPTNDEIRKKRIEAIYAEDEGMPIRKSHEVPQIKEIYADFLKKPLGEKSHELLHTKYRKRNRH